jgi:beta-lactamase regulating signal transducer with metallopeptidase domain
MKTENENGNNIILIALILALLGAIFLTSCGSRKVQKSETKEQEQKTEKITLETKTRVTDNTKIVDTSTSDEIEICPVSDSLPMVVNGITYKNVKIRRKKTKNNISINKDVKVQHNAQKSELKTVKRDLIIERKLIDRKQSYWWLLWFLLLIPVYYVWRKYKGFFI